MYACSEFDDDLRELVRRAGGAHGSANADTTLKSTDFFRYMIGDPPTELTSTRKGKTADSTLNAYAEIQAVSSKKHLAINRTICRMMDRNVPDFDLAHASSRWTRATERCLRTP